MQTANKSMSFNNFAVALVTAVLIAGLSACASEEKTAKGPEAPQQAAADAARATGGSQSTGGQQGQPEMIAQGTIEAQPSAEELALKQKEERQKADAAKKTRAEEARQRAEAAAVAAAEEMRKVYFDFDRYEIKDEFRPMLSKNANLIKREKPDNVVIEGHCDERGTEDYNLALGQRRAVSVKNYLISTGVNPNRLSTISFGEERPEVRGQGEDAWSKNRRVQFSQ